MIIKVTEKTRTTETVVRATRFESAVRRVHRSARIEWLPKTGTQIKKLIETPQKPYLRPNGEPPDPRPTETRRQTLTPSGPA